MSFLLALTAVILLHDLEGREIRVNPDQVTHLRAAKLGETDKLFPAHAKCMVNLADGKFLAVVETCAEIQRMLEQRL